jgi:hypothetical protein
LSHPVQETKDIPWLGILLIVSALLITWFAYQQWQVTNTEEQSSEQFEPESSDSIPSVPSDKFESSVVEPIVQDLSMLLDSRVNVTRFSELPNQFNTSIDKDVASFTLGVES